MDAEKLSMSNSTKISELSYLPIVETATNRTLSLTDAGKVIIATDAAIITVPPNADVAFPVGTQIVLIAETANAVSVAKGTGVTIEEPELTLDGDNASATLLKRAADIWHLIGKTKV